MDNHKHEKMLPITQNNNPYINNREFGEEDPKHPKNWIVNSLADNAKISMHRAIAKHIPFSNLKKLTRIILEMYLSIINPMITDTEDMKTTVRLDQNFICKHYRNGISKKELESAVNELSQIKIINKKNNTENILFDKCMLKTDLVSSSTYLLISCSSSAESLFFNPNQTDFNGCKGYVRSYSRYETQNLTQKEYALYIYCRAAISKNGTNIIYINKNVLYTLENWNSKTLPKYINQQLDLQIKNINEKTSLKINQITNVSKKSCNTVFEISIKKYVTNDMIQEIIHKYNEENQYSNECEKINICLKELSSYSDIECRTLAIAYILRYSNNFSQILNSLSKYINKSYSEHLEAIINFHNLE